jgi:hypothetical protein
MRIDMSPRELVALYLHLEMDPGGADVRSLQERLAKKLCEGLSIEQFEMLESLYKRGYEFNELRNL